MASQFEYGSSYAPSLSGGSMGGGGSSGGIDIKSFMDMLSNNKGLFGLGDLATGGLLGMGSSLLVVLGGLLACKSDGEKRTEKTFNLAENRLGQDVLQPEQYLAEYMRAAAPKFNAQAEGINRRLGLDSGVAQGEMAHSMQSDLASFMLNAKMQNDQMKSQRDNMLLSLMGSLGGQ